MDIKFLGATNDVTGSKFLLKGKNHNILIDCGMYQGPDSEKQNKETIILLKQEKIDAIILTHAHLDHSGHIPTLIRYSRNNIPIFSSEATKELAYLIMSDNAKIQSLDAKNINKKISKTKNKVDPIYTQINVEQAIGQFRVKKIGKTFHFNEFAITFENAGHILGARTVHIETDETSIVFSGDLGRSDDLTVYPPVLQKRSKNLVLESTYGDREHNHANIFNEFKKILEQNKKNNGTMVIAAFALGRSQTILFLLDQIMQNAPELRTPVYFDTPLGQSIFDLYYKFTEEHKISESVLDRIKKEFCFLEHISMREKMHKLPHKIIVAASGMLEGGHVVEHIAQYADNPSNAIVFVGYQSQSTMGHDILHGKKHVHFENGQNTEINAQIYNLELISSHADKNELLQWSKNIAPKQVFLVHGETKSKESLCEALKSHLSAEIIIPVLNQSYPI